MPTAARDGEPESLRSLLGGRRAGVDAALPAIAFVTGWYLSGRSILIGGTVALVIAIAIAVYRLTRGERPRAVLVGVLGVVVAAAVAVYTGRAEDFFIVRLLSNAASALIWAISIIVQWPLLGVVVGTVLRQGRSWRRDPVLRRAYAAASWVWVGQYTVRVVVFGSLWAIGAVAALGIASAVLTWPLVALCIAVSAVVMRRSLPADHPGLRHPHVVNQ